MAQVKIEEEEEEVKTRWAYRKYIPWGSLSDIMCV